MSPEKMPTIYGADRFSRRGGHLPTTRDIYEPIVYHLEIAGGIVKHGSAIGRVLKRTGGPYFFIEEKRRMRCPSDIKSSGKEGEYKIKEAAD